MLKRILFLLIPAVLLAPRTDRKPLLTVGVVTDIHYNSDRAPRNNRYYMISDRKLSEAIDTFNVRGVDMVACLGDMIDKDIDSYEVIGEIFRTSKAPVYKVLGNHDFFDVYGSETQDRVLELEGVREPYFSLSPAKGLRLIFLPPPFCLFQFCFQPLFLPFANHPVVFLGPLGSDSRK